MQGGVEEYLGIPYALPPLGDLRFAPTVDTNGWLGASFLATR